MLRTALFLIALTTPALAQTANQRAEQEAISFLKPCNQHDADDVKSCQENQWFFVRSYMAAKAGNPGEMLRIASYFDVSVTPDERDASLGIPEDPVQSCAWRIWNLARTSPASFDSDAADFETQQVCPMTSIRDYGAAFVRAGRLAHEFKVDPASDPGDDWHPHIPWIKSNPSPNLDSTVAPLTADPPASR